MEYFTKIWEETIMLPTYCAEKPEKNPLFIEKRAYQGSTGKVYPLPVVEKVSDTKRDMPYRAVWLENEYLKVMVLPELGGRIHRAYDKTNDYDFVYYNHVVKPALVGLAGPWISGGIEFNWPQHHRPSTFSPVDYTIKNNKDGSVTVFVGETDKMYGTKGMAAISLYPGKAYIEIKGQLYNPTDLPQTFLWWANPAVPVNDNTYSVFPPDVNAVMDHGKRAVSTFPIATGEYYKCDYSAGVDISRYKNVPVPTSYMAAHSDYDFIGNYDEQLNAGLLHVASHHVSPGKKQWTWGNGDFGRAWDRNLTDEDGPYIELMTGVFTDNQPDFTWLKPQEEKEFVQYFMPYKGVGRVGNATKDAAVSFEQIDNKNAFINVYASADYTNALITITKEDKCIFEQNADLSPKTAFKAKFKCAKDLAGCKATVKANDKIIVEYSVYEPQLTEIPKPADALKAPSELKSTEELYLAATHLEQYRHATFEPADYYIEGLRRDASDIRLNNGYGLLLYRRGQIKESIEYFNKAIEKQTWKNPNPFCGDSYFNLGIALEANGDYEKAYDAFYKATWSAETQSAAFYHLACLQTRKCCYEEAFTLAQSALVRNWHSMKVRALLAALQRKLGCDNTKLLNESLAIDPLYMGCLYEKALHENAMDAWQGIMRTQAHNYLELALDYIKAALYDDAVTILKSCKEENPLLSYYEGYAHYLAGAEAAAVKCFKYAEKLSSDYCFPNRVEEIDVLNTAISLLKVSPKAHAYLGCLLYDKKQYQEAVQHWEASIKQDFAQANVHRNLAIAYYNKHQNAEKAMEEMQQALKLDAEYPRLLLEYDQLCARMGLSNKQRLNTLEKALPIVQCRDDLYLRYITLLNCEGWHLDAYNAIMSRKFHPWEGGEGKTSAQYRYALIHLAIDAIIQKDYTHALELLKQSKIFADNLGEGKLPNEPDNEADYYMGKAYRLAGDEINAKKYFQQATAGSQEPGSVLYYNDQPSDFIYFQGLAHGELGNAAAALKAFNKLVAYGEQHLFDKVGYDFFAVSLPEIEVFADDIALRNEQYCNYLRALGYLGRGDSQKANSIYKQILSKQPDYQRGADLFE